MTPKTAATRTPKSKSYAEWEFQIDEVLRSDINEDQAARVLINLLPTFPDEGKEEAAEHIANLLADKDYRAVLPILVNPQMPESVHETLFTDLMDRDDAVKLRTFVEIAKVPSHRMREEALDDLELFLDDDYGNDWAKWNAAIDKYLKEQEQ
jgi:hypothetical protein